MTKASQNAALARSVVELVFANFTAISDYRGDTEFRVTQAHLVQKGFAEIMASLAGRDSIGARRAMRDHVTQLMAWRLELEEREALAAVQKANRLARERFTIGAATA